jgi:molybdenum cofactor biosynthesis enzyme MoaA
MMRFPLRLTADINIARIAKKLGFPRRAHPIQFLDAAEVLHPDSSHPVSHERMREVISSSSPIVWIGGSEPLHHPGVSHLVRATTQTGHFVFLETDGTVLRRRLHEFQPVSRLFLTVRFEPCAQRRASKGTQADGLELAAEGIRAARLSGFLICVHARVHAESELGEMARLIQFALSLDVDGIVVTPADGGSSSANPDAALQRRTAEVRKMIGSWWWQSFSRLIEPIVNGGRHAEQSAEGTAVRLDQETPADEEGVRVA